MRLQIDYTAAPSIPRRWMRAVAAAARASNMLPSDDRTRSVDPGRNRFPSPALAAVLGHVPVDSSQAAGRLLLLVACGVGTVTVAAE